MPVLNVEQLQDTYLVLGKPGSGKSQAAREIVENEGAKKTLYLRLALTPKRLIPASADVLVASSWGEFIKDYRAATKGKTKYDAVILEGLHVLLGMAVQEIAGEGQPSQQEWGKISRMVWQEVLHLQELAPLFVATVDVKPDEEGTDQVALNRDTFVKLLPHFSHKFYTSMEMTFSNGSPVTGSEKYFIEGNPMLALNFMRSVDAPKESEED